MSAESNNKFWWLGHEGSVNICIPCDSELQIVFPSALQHHSITNKHKNNVKKYKRKLKTNLKETKKRSQDSDRNVIKNEKKRRLEYQSATKDLYDYYLSSSEITEYLSNSSEVLKNMFLTVLNDRIISRFYKMLLKDIDTKPFSLFLEEVSESIDRSRIIIVIRYYSDKFKKFICLFLNVIIIDVKNFKNKPMKMVDIIEETAKDFNLQLKNLTGIGIHADSIKQNHDNTQVFKYLQRKYEILCFYPILCISNSIQKAFLNAFPDSITREKLELLIEDTYDWFDNEEDTDNIWYERLNVKQIQAYKRQFDDVSWFFVPGALNNIFKNWNDLNNYFKKIRKQSTAADDLYDEYNDEYNKACLLCIDEHLKDVIKANEEFESLEPDAVKMLSTFIKLKNEISELNDEYKTYGVKGFQVDFIEKFNENLSILNLAVEKSNRSYNSYDEIKNNMKKLNFRLDHEKNIIALSENEATKSKIISEWNKLQSCLSLIPDKKKLQKPWETIFDQKDSYGDRLYREICSLAMKHLSLPLSDFNVKRIFHELNFEEIKKIKDSKLTTINNILRIQNYLKYINECGVKDSEDFLEVICEELITFAAYVDPKDIAFEVLNEEDDDILLSMKKRLNIIPL